jgi:hypothetical protein
MKYLKTVLILTLGILMLASCKSRWVGQSVDMNSVYICSWESLPNVCEVTYPQMRITYEIKETGNENEYTISGTGYWIGAEEGWNNFREAQFELLLIDGNTVVETLQMLAGLGSIKTPIKFNRKFTTENKFQGSAINYKLILIG